MQVPTVVEYLTIFDSLALIFACSVVCGLFVPTQITPDVNL